MDKTIIEGFKALGISEEDLAPIMEAFDDRVEQLAQEKSEVDVAAALEQQANEHKALLEQILEKAERIKAKEIAKINEEHTALLEQLLQKHQQLVENTARVHRDQLVDTVSGYLDVQLENLIPDDVIEEAANNNIARSILNRIQQLAGLDEKFITGNIREALQEGKQIIDQQKQEIANLKRKSLQSESVALLASKTRNMPSNQVEYIAEHFKGKSPDFIRRNFDYVLESFNRSNQTDRKKLADVTRRAAITRNVNRPIVEDDDEQKQPGVIEESNKPSAPAFADDPFGYLDELGKY